MKKKELRKYVVCGGEKKDGSLLLALFPTYKRPHVGETIPHAGRLWEVVGELPHDKGLAS